ncbi:MAG: glycoside hydrolase family 97 catalytic domain-containing protein [Bacteroidales bacterium]|jgi:alpha-glucosidase|nr:glycoside hydrolase family 97 catalytic domain-containing protein [Bacteroidales bacterium]
MFHISVKKIKATCLAIYGLLVLFLFPVKGMQERYDISSPDGALKIRLNISDEIHYEVFYNDVVMITPSKISMTLEDGRVIGKAATIEDIKSKSIHESIPLLYGKHKSLDDTCNELAIVFTEGYSLIARAYNEGVAYRFETKLGGSLTVKSEEANFNFSGSPSVWFPEADENMWSWERSYRLYASIKNIGAGEFAVTPAMFSYPETGIRVVIAESDQTDYPGMYIQPSGENSVKGKWAQYPKTVTDPDNVYAYHRVTERYDYLARTSGDRSYPWRVIIVSAQDKDLLNNELIFKLAKPQQITGTDWIKPGKSAWEWWHDGILEGVSIPSGEGNLSFDVYKYYIDFAAKYKLEYVTLDAGYDAGYVKQVCDYAASVGVKIFLWDFINLPVRNPDRITELKNYGAVGIKVDLIERDDQVAMNWIEKLAKDCADREMMLVLHGCPKPSGLQRAYPNIVNFEAVRGAECNKWDATANPDYHLQFLFIRMLAGPLDYTPGSMRNVNKANFSAAAKGIPMSMGTRSHELAMYVLFDQPLAYLCDSPVEYPKYRDIMKFLSAVPTVWDQTVPLAAEMGEYAAIAKKSGDDWYVGAMTNWKSRSVEIDFSFLPDGISYSADVYRDNDESAKDAGKYTCETIPVTKQTKSTFQLAPGGGVAIRIKESVPTGISDFVKHDSENNIVVYPNINRQEINIKSEIRFDLITVYDVKGAAMIQKPYNKESAIQQLSINSLKEGCYIVRLAGKAGSYSVKFIK